MENYKIKYEILDYDKYHDRLNKIVENPRNLFPVRKEKDLGESSCGFKIEHYTIGNGPKHIVYMAGTHGNEIIGVDYITQLMENVALGNGSYSDFDPNEYTLDFIPCQNPEGFYITTYALKSFFQNKTEEEIEQFCKNYYLAYREDDKNAMNTNQIIKNSLKELGLQKKEKEIINKFWLINRNKEIDFETILAFFKEFLGIESEELRTKITKEWQDLFQDKKIPALKKHLEIFKGISVSCIPERDENHKKLRNALQKLYGSNLFPIETLATFFANAKGVNLNDNNEFYYEELRARKESEQAILGNLRDNNLIKSEPGPIGTASENLSDPFKQEQENEIILDFIKELDVKGQIYGFFNIHSTGGLLYIYPVFENDADMAHKEGVERDFTFYINNRLGTEYTSSIGKYYEQETGTYSPYTLTSHPDRITGLGDYFRKNYIAAFLLELSKMGGNPIGPYGDKEGNFKNTMIANMEANSRFLKILPTVRYLYDSTYKMSYDANGRVHYEEGIKRKY